VERDYVLTRERFESIVGQKMDTALRSLFGLGISSEEMAHLEAVKETRCRALMQAGGVTPLPGVLGWLDALRAAGWHQAVAPSAADPLLGQVENLLDEPARADRPDGFASQAK